VLIPFFDALGCASSLNAAEAADALSKLAGSSTTEDAHTAMKIIATLSSLIDSGKSEKEVASILKLSESYVSFSCTSFKRILFLFQT